jgi:hypothetical protein
MLADFSTTIGLGSVIVAVAMVILAVPTFVLARRALVAENEAHEAARLAAIVKQVVAGDLEIVPPRSPAHPSLADLLVDIRDNTHETAMVTRALGRHTSDGHGAR